MLDNIRRLNTVYRLRNAAEANAYALDWWDCSTAAARWGVSWDTAKRWMLRHPDRAVLVPVLPPHSRKQQPIYRLCVPMGTARTTDDYCYGNPAFRDSDWQRRNFYRRYPGGKPPAKPEQPPKLHGNTRDSSGAEVLPGQIGVEELPRRRYGEDDRDYLRRIGRSR